MEARYDASIDDMKRHYPVPVEEVGEGPYPGGAWRLYWSHEDKPTVCLWLSEAHDSGEDVGGGSSGACGQERPIDASGGGEGLWYGQTLPNAAWVVARDNTGAEQRLDRLFDAPAGTAKSKCFVAYIVPGRQLKVATAFDAQGNQLATHTFDFKPI
jgi:hypothetical protein